MALVEIFWGVGDPTVLRFWGLFISKCMKISIFDFVRRQVQKSEGVIIMVTLNHNVKESQMNVLQ